MNTCKTCKHWDKPSGDWGYCQKIVAGSICGFYMVAPCTDEEMKQQGHRRPQTAHAFGCIFHEPLPLESIEVTTLNDDKPQFIEVPNV